MFVRLMRCVDYAPLLYALYETKLSPFGNPLYEQDLWRQVRPLLPNGQGRRPAMRAPGEERVLPSVANAGIHTVTCFAK